MMQTISFPKKESLQAPAADPIMLILASWGHDIMQQCSSILQINSMINKEDPEEVLEFLENTLSRIWTLHHVARSMYQFSKTQEDGLNFIDIDLNEFFTSRKEIAQYLISYSNRKLSWNMDLSGGTKTDPNKLCLILDNLITNACKYSPQESSIEVTVTSNNGELLITITNDYPSFPPHALEKIFDPYVRLDTTGPGCGIGLSTCKRLCRQLGGDIHAVSTTTTLSMLVRLPIAL
ncbi:Histidine kinase-, DNA gyrase B-, and HSP90-like ATPase [Chitinophaga jiangningensis]|uniref:Histidine kinase-, DNA gyrase B-, and HSP90-like ATPase n=1 Tax=Chitinophaga jiangningensis TaxID=1419482 RepID=A0A1M6WI13_9BACT|nr:HAMP domain-containing sensor histidine kinase [Chitinophaga jiangningensis]SHK93321.1 Histidine kinase-, DNA gyrase B-, and HSP90-like ATPase [Chitinophaga jiangningensis]